MTADSPAHPTPKVQVYCVEDHTLVQLGLVALINATPDLVVCGQSTSFAHACAEIPQSSADLALIDLSLRDGSGLDLIKEMRRLKPSLRTCAFSVHDEVAYAPRALRAGASGYLMKSESPESLLGALRRIAAGHKVVSDRVIATFIDPLCGRGTATQDFTDREIEIVELYGAGAPSAEICARLGLSAKALAMHRSNLRRKFHLGSSGQFIRFCVEWSQRAANGDAPPPPS